MMNLKGTNNILHKISTKSAHQCVTTNAISTMDGRDLAQINCIRIFAKTEVYTVSILNTNPTNDLSSNTTVYDSNRYLNTNYNCRNFVSSLEGSFVWGTIKFSLTKLLLITTTCPL